MQRRSFVFGATVTAALLIAGCGSDKYDFQHAPESQRAWVNQVQSLQRSWAEAQSNALQRDAIEANAKAFFTRKQEVVKWWGVVERVSTSMGSTWVRVKYAGIVFLLWPEDKGFSNKPMPIFSELRQGDEVLFTGTMTREMSLTMTGAMTEPEMKIQPTDVSRI